MAVRDGSGMLKRVRRTEASTAKGSHRAPGSARAEPSHYSGGGQRVRSQRRGPPETQPWRPRSPTGVPSTIAPARQRQGKHRITAQSNSQNIDLFSVNISWVIRIWRPERADKAWRTSAPRYGAD